MRPRHWLLVLLAIVVVALSLRAPFLAVAPIIDLVQSDLGLSAAAAGMLIGLPVLCFAAFTPFASMLIGRAGANLATLISLAGVILGVVVRSTGTTAAVFAGTLVIGAFITVGNVVIPVIIRRDAPRTKVGLATGIYTAALNVGGMVATVATAPIAANIGWNAAIALWVIVAAIGVVVWVIVMRPRGLVWKPDVISAETAAQATATAAPETRTWTSPTIILLCVAFAGQSFSYYGVTAWLPSLLADTLGVDREQAGAAAGIFQILALVGAIGAPLLASRIGITPTITINALLWLTVPVGFLFAPQFWALWMVFGGAAQGAGMVNVLTIAMHTASSGTHAKRISALVQGFAYLVGATAASLLGGLHEATGMWQWPLTAVLVAVLLFGSCGIAAARRSAKLNAAS